MALPQGALRASLASSANLKTGQAPASRARLLPTRPLHSLKAQQAMLPLSGNQGGVAAASPAAAGAAVVAATQLAVSCDCIETVGVPCWHLHGRQPLLSPFPLLPSGSDQQRGRAPASQPPGPSASATT